MQRQRKREWPNETLGDLMNLLAAQGRTAKNASQRAKQKLKKTEKHLKEKHILSCKHYVELNMYEYDKQLNAVF